MSRNMQRHQPRQTLEKDVYAGDQSKAGHLPEIAAQSGHRDKNKDTVSRRTLIPTEEWARHMLPSSNSFRITAICS